MLDQPQSVLRVPGDYDEATADDAQVQYAAAAGIAHIISGIAWSYGNAPAGGGIEVYDGDGTDAAQLVFALDINTDGPGYPIKFEPHLRGTAGRAMTVKLLDAGADVKGRINVLGHYAQG